MAFRPVEFLASDLTIATMVMERQILTADKTVKPRKPMSARVCLAPHHSFGGSERQGNYLEKKMNIKTGFVNLCYVFVKSSLLIVGIEEKVKVMGGWKE